LTPVLCEGRCSVLWSGPGESWIGFAGISTIPPPIRIFAFFDCARRLTSHFLTVARNWVGNASVTTLL
jgi:hypothetical protein